ncbi:hypothetical protein DMENIID0001_164710 [Sergentomyia squamirostris]
MNVPEGSTMNTSMENCEKIANSICSLSMNESTSVYYSLNGTQEFSSDLEKSTEAEDDLVSLEIPDLSLDTAAPALGHHPLSICDLLMQKPKNLLSSTPNKITVASSGEPSKTEVVLPVPENDDDLEKIEDDEESTIKSDNSLIGIAEKSPISVQTIEEKEEAPKMISQEEAKPAPTKILETKFKGGEDLLKFVIEEEAEEPQEEKHEKDNQETAKVSEDQIDRKNPDIPEIVVTEEVTDPETEVITEKDDGKKEDPENKENVSGKMRRRSKIAIPENNSTNKNKNTGKQSLIRRSILKTEVRSPAKTMKAAPMPLPRKRSSLLPQNPVVNKRQTLGPSKPLKRTSLLPAPPIKPEATAPIAKTRRTMAPTAGFPRMSPQKPLTTKAPPEIQKPTVFLHPNALKPALPGFECKVCKKKFRTASILETHVKTHKESGKSGFACKYCERRFEIKKGLENHIQNYCSKIPVGEKRRLLAEEAKLAAMTPRSKRLAARAQSDASSAGSSNSDFMAMLKLSPRSHSEKRMSIAFQGISATPNRTIRCYQCRKEFGDVFEFSNHITEHVDNN